MGFMLGGRFASLFGLRTSARSARRFTNVFVYADPSRDIAVSLMTSGQARAVTRALTRTLLVMQTIAHRIPRDGKGPLRRR